MGDFACPFNPQSPARDRKAAGGFVHKFSTSPRGLDKGTEIGSTMRTRETHNLSHHVRNIRAVHPAVVPAFDQKWKIAVGGMGGSLVSQDAIFA